MKVRKFTASVADLNALPYIDFDITFSDINGNLFYPKAIQYINTTGASIGYMYLESTSEMNEVYKTPYLYEYLTLPSDTSTADLPATKIIRISILNGAASKDLVFYTIGSISWSTNH